jgi:hypothetical protein
MDKRTRNFNGYISILYRSDDQGKPSPHFSVKNIHEKISQFWLAKSTAILSKYNSKKEVHGKCQNKRHFE